MFLFRIIILSTFIVQTVFCTGPSGLDRISSTYFGDHIRYLSSEELEGREATYPGQRLAAEYIASHFESLGLEPAGDDGTYYQRFYLERTRPSDTSKLSVISEGDTLHISGYGENYLMFGIHFPTMISSSIVFAKYGIIDESLGRNDYAGLDVNGSVAMVLDGYPSGDAGPDDRLIRQTTRSSMLRAKIANARTNGARALIIVSDALEEKRHELSDYFEKGTLSMPGSPRGGFPIVIADTRTAHVLTGGTRDLHLDDLPDRNSTSYTHFPTGEQSIMLLLTFNVDKDLRETENVIGMLRGGDPELRDEVVILTAHYDHLGKHHGSGEIYNGADDNASGTAALMEIARVFSHYASDLRRSLLFIACTAEEKGLLGSRYYTENPAVPLGQTVANLNIDMIGRVDTIYAAKNIPNYVYIIGSDRLSAGLHGLHEQALAFNPEITVDYRYNDPGDPNRFYYRSDHYNFIRNNIPSIFYFTGTHDDYHRPTDTWDKIDYDKMEHIIRLIYTTAWKLSQTEVRPLPDPVPAE